MEISAFYLQCSNCSSQKPWKCQKKTNLSLYTLRKKKKTQRKSSTNESNCSCSNSSTSESHLPWRISNFIYENENSRFSLLQIPSEKPSCPSSSADASFISENRSIVNVTDNIFQDTEILSPIPCQSFPPQYSVATSTPTHKSQRFKVFFHRAFPFNFWCRIVQLSDMFRWWVFWSWSHVIATWWFIDTCIIGKVWVSTF